MTKKYLRERNEKWKNDGFYRFEIEQNAYFFFDDCIRNAQRWNEIHRDGCARHTPVVNTLRIHVSTHYVANHNGILADSTIDHDFTIIGEHVRFASARARPTSVAQTRKRIVKSSYLLQHRDTACGKRRMRMRLVYTYEEVGVYVMIVCTRARTAWMNVARKSLREICYFRRDCVLSTCLYTGCHWISGLKFASVFSLRESNESRMCVIGT